MKKSELRKIIKESIKELMNEQTTHNWSGPHAYYYLKCCDPSGPTHTRGDNFPDTYQVGDVITGNHPSYQNYPWFIFSKMGPNNQGINPNNPGNIQPASAQNCSQCCDSTLWGSFPMSGPCTLNCGSTSAGSCNPAAWSNHANWTSTFTNTVNNLNPNNPNQPCNFLNQKIAQFTASASGGGQGGAQNVWNCKLDLANQLHAQNNC
jgi:hypothetical protein